MQQNGYKHRPYTFQKKNEFKMHHRPKDFLHSSADKEPACNAGDPGLIPELGSSPGEAIGYLKNIGYPIPKAQS